MVDVSVQVREYFEYMADHVEVEEVTRGLPELEPIGSDKLLQTPPKATGWGEASRLSEQLQIEPVKKSWRQRPLLVAITAAVIVTAAIGSLALLVRLPGERTFPAAINGPATSAPLPATTPLAAVAAAVAANGEVWALTEVSEGVEVLSRFDGVAWTNYPQIPVTNVPHLLGSPRIRMSPTGDIWVVSHDESYSDDPTNPDPWFRLAHFDGSVWSIHELGHLPLLGSFEVSPDGTVWFGTWVGAARFDGQRLEEWRFVTGDVASCCGIKWVAFAPDGTVWAQGDKGVSRFDGDDWTHYTPDDGLASSHVHAPVQFAADGTVWASGREGVSVFDGSTWVAYTSADGLDADVEAWRVILTPDGVAWAVATEEKIWASWSPTTVRGLYRFDGATWQPLTETAPPPLWKIAFDDDGIAWALSQVGVVSFDGSAWNVHDPGVGAIEGYELNPKDGSAWAYGRGGVARFDGQSWHRQANEDGQAFGSVKAVMFSPDGNVWLIEDAQVTRLVPTD